MYGLDSLVVKSLLRMVEFRSVCCHAIFVDLESKTTDASKVPMY
jgi:hypothetical protein